MRAPLMTLILLITLTHQVAIAPAAEPKPWQPDTAAKYLDQRQQSWFDFKHATRGKGPHAISCVSCHTAASYSLARPALRQLAGDKQPTALETKIIQHITHRVENWDRIETPDFGVAYDDDPEKTRQSKGTESIINAWTLANHDARQLRPTASPATKQALAILWKTQITTGDRPGSWEWLDFGLEPWEGSSGRYYGATLAYLAAATAPAYLTEKDPARDMALSKLRDYLRQHAPQQNLFNRTSLLLASTRIPDLISPADQQAILKDLLAQQQDTGGWSLASLGTYQRSDKTAIPTHLPRRCRGVLWSDYERI